MTASLDEVGGVPGGDKIRQFLGIEHLTTQAHRPRYGVNLANAHAISSVVGPIGESYIAPAASCFGTGRLNNVGTTTRNFDALA